MASRFHEKSMLVGSVMLGVTLVAIGNAVFSHRMVWFWSFLALMGIGLAAVNFRQALARRDR